MRTIVACVLLSVVGCGTEDGLTKTASPLTGNWQIGYEGGWSGWMDVNAPEPGGEFGGLFVCITQSEGYVHGDVAGHQDGEHVALEIHHAAIEADLRDGALTGTALVDGQSFPFHGHR